MVQAAGGADGAGRLFGLGLMRRPTSRACGGWSKDCCCTGTGRRSTRSRPGRPDRPAAAPVDDRGAGPGVRHSAEPVDVARAPIDRALCICRDFTLLYTALLRAQGVPARARCGFSSYFDPAKWYDHWITERWDGPRWVRERPGRRPAARAGGARLRPLRPATRYVPRRAQAWVACPGGRGRPERFGIFDMWGPQYIGGNLSRDLACLNKVELLPWDTLGPASAAPRTRRPTSVAELHDDLAALVVSRRHRRNPRPLPHRRPPLGSPPTSPASSTAPPPPSTSTSDRRWPALCRVRCRGALAPVAPGRGAVLRVVRWSLTACRVKGPADEAAMLSAAPRPPP